MSRLSQLLILFILPPFFLFAQNRQLTIEEATNMNPKLNAANLSQLQWQPGTNKFFYVAKNALIQGSADKSGRDTLTWLEELNLQLKQNNLDTLKRFPVVTFLANNQFLFTTGNKYCCMTFRKKLSPLKIPGMIKLRTSI